MSLLEFPEPPLIGQSVTHGYGGKLTIENAVETSKFRENPLMSSYPLVDKRQLMGLQHSLSREDVRSVFLETENYGKFGRLYSIWRGYGIHGVLSYVGSLPESGNAWAAVKLCHLILRFANVFGSYTSSWIPKLMNYHSTEDLIACNVDVLDWKSNWIRALAWHRCGTFVALCQRNDYIRIHQIGEGCRERNPITLRHVQQRNVTQMAWKPYAPMVLAVACDKCILIWNLNPGSLTTRPAASCAKVLFLSNCVPITQLTWDNTGSFLVYSSPNSGKLLIWDSTIDNYDSVSWSWSGIIRLNPSPNCYKILVSYGNKVIRVFESCKWRYETWSGLDGCCRCSVWSPDNNQLIFSSTDSYLLYALSFGSETTNETTKSSLGGSANAVPVYDFRPIRFENDTQRLEIGGVVQQMKLNDDGSCLAVTFRDNPETVALLTVSWKPNVQLIPYGFIREANGARAELIDFQPNYAKGALLTIIWSNGTMQFVPLLFSTNLNKVLPEPIVNASPILFSE